jgi:hypothetical protein
MPCGPHKRAGTDKVHFVEKVLVTGVFVEFPYNLDKTDKINLVKVNS